MLRLSLLILLCAAASTLGQTQPCASTHPSLVGWWQAENNGLDRVGQNNGVVNADFVAGRVGQAFSFNGLNQSVIVPNGPGLSPTRLTLEAWIKPLVTPADVVAVVVKESDWDAVHYQIGFLNANGRNRFRAVMGFSPGLYYVDTLTPIVPGNWYHVALTYDGQAMRIYLNGVLEGITAHEGIVRTGNQPLYMGTERGGWNFNGLLDEVALYSQALSAQEIATIYATGKCSGPVISSHPRSQVGFWGKEVSFSVSASGENPLSYYWKKDGVTFPGANSPMLSLTNLQMTDAGSYSVIVSNRSGMTTSSAAILTMNPAGVSSSLYTGITIDGVVGFVYGIQVSTNINDSTGWRGIANVTLSTPQQLWLDLQPAVQARRFYRVVPGPIVVP